MDRDDIKDGLIYFFSIDNSKSFSINEIKNFFNINSVFDYEVVDDLASFLSEMVNERLIISDSSPSEELFSLGDDGSSRIAGRNEELGERWIIPRVENYDYVESGDNKPDDDFTLVADEKESDGPVNEKNELIYEE